MAEYLAAYVVAATVATQCYWSYGKLRDDKKDEESRRISNPHTLGLDAMSMEGLTAQRSGGVNAKDGCEKSVGARGLRWLGFSGLSDLALKRWGFITWYFGDIWQLHCKWV
jgi:hypothetical protein